MFVYLLFLFNQRRESREKWEGKQNVRLDYLVIQSNKSLNHLLCLRSLKKKQFICLIKTFNRDQGCHLIDFYGKVPIFLSGKKQTFFKLTTCTFEVIDLSVNFLILKLLFESLVTLVDTLLNSFSDNLSIQFSFAEKCSKWWRKSRARNWIEWSSILSLHFMQRLHCLTSVVADIACALTQNAPDANRTMCLILFHLREKNLNLVEQSRLRRVVQAVP